MICLDVLRVPQRPPDTVAALRPEPHPACGVDRRLDFAIAALEVELSDMCDKEPCARQFPAQIATATEAALFVRGSITAPADASVALRLEGLPNRSFGRLPHHCDLASIVARSRLS
ncbi:MAG: hypothetical protein J0I54_16420 [Bosea sp.]|uniref:hypothetical protein n=1 Tax=unclassified Bosea (in: a-proteobacteria) TaxID=2653178 RepID=UPI00095E1FE5|nr:MULTISPECIES: hypothetical protein [unclassified Bosea (in: a-proteobacteria)]MBN9458217.1 hypothetical protein [Bosea sp. (in: a-proteobacteria)]OJV07041.1 MAG: hypothetical protein BGO20_01510 [Bosea sp. 67-29]